MPRIAKLGFVLVFFLALGGAVCEMSRPSLRADCAECGNGPKDKKCPDGYKCVNSKCVKK